MRKYMKPYRTCPFYNGEESKCTRPTGCLFLTPCVNVNDPNLRLEQAKRPKKKKGR